jgi:hypothetical protein
MTIDKFRQALLGAKAGDEIFQIITQQEASL